METILFVVVVALLMTGLIGLFSNNDPKTLTTWVYYLCCFAAGILVGVIAGDLTLGIMAGLIICLMTGYIATISRWGGDLGTRLDTWNKKRIKKADTDTPDDEPD